MKFELIATDGAARRGTLHFDDLQFEQDYDPASAYQQSKLACLMFARELAKQMPGQLMYFLAGAWAWCHRETLLRWRHRVGAAGLLILCLVAARDGHPTQGADVWDILAPIGLTAAVMWLALVVRPVAALQPRHDLSYGLYLWHFPVIQACVATGLLAWSVWLGALAALVLTVVLAWASWRLIEAPALRHR